MKNTKKKKVSHLYTKQLFGCLFEKTKASAGRLLFLDLFWKRGKDNPSILFFFAGIALLSKQEKRIFFLKLFFVLFAKVISKSKTFESRTCKKKAFFSCPHTNWCTNDTHQNPMKGGVGFYWKKSSIFPPLWPLFFLGKKIFFSKKKKRSQGGQEMLLFFQ